MGEASALAQPGRGFSRSMLALACEIYRQLFGSDGGRIPATFQLLTMSGWAPDPSQPRPIRRGSGEVHLAEALGVPLDGWKARPGAERAPLAGPCLRSSCSRCRAISLFLMALALGHGHQGARSRRVDRGRRALRGAARRAPAAPRRAPGRRARGLPESAPVSRSCCSSCSIICLRASPSTTGGSTGGSRTGPRAGFEIAAWEGAPLELAGRLVQEDLCLMQRGDAGYRLVAAVLCFPPIGAFPTSSVARWRPSTPRCRASGSGSPPRSTASSRASRSRGRSGGSTGAWSTRRPCSCRPSTGPPQADQRRAGRPELWLRGATDAAPPAGLGRRRVRDPYPRRPARGRDRCARSGARARRTHPRNAGRHGALQEHPADPRALLAWLDRRAEAQGPSGR